MKVILVVDMLNGFHNMGNLANPRTASIIPNIRELLERKMKEGGYRVVFLNDNHLSDDKEFEMFPPHCVEGTEETNVVAELQEFCDMGNNTVYPKKRYSGFFQTYLEGLLVFERPEEVIVVGVCTDICVLHTVADLRNRDYQVIVPADCVETFDAPNHNAGDENGWALGHMQYILGATIVDSQLEI